MALSQRPERGRFAASAPHLYLDLLAPETSSLSLVLFLSNSTAFDLALHVRDM